VTADAAHVAAVAEALMNAPAASLGPFLAPIAATVAVETLTPLIAAERDALAVENAHLRAQVQAVEALDSPTFLAALARYAGSPEDQADYIEDIIRTALATTEAGEES
jgi:hypothetical protein